MPPGPQLVELEALIRPWSTGAGPLCNWALIASATAAKVNLASAQQSACVKRNADRLALNRRALETAVLRPQARRRRDEVSAR